MKTKTKAKPKVSHDTMRVNFEVKSFDSATGKFTGYAAAWGNVDEVQDVCQEGCFAATLQHWRARGTWPRVLWQHWFGVGHVTELREDEHGLFVAGTFWMDKPEVAEVYKEIATAMPNVGLSFGFVAIDFEVLDGVRYLARVDLTDDITVTLRPVNDQAAMVEMKSADGSSITVPSIRATEAILRDAGFTRTAAKTVLASGYAALREAKSADDPKIRTSLENLFDSLQKATGALDDGNSGNS